MINKKLQLCSYRIYCVHTIKLKRKKIVLNGSLSSLWSLGKSTDGKIEPHGNH